jgi:hypothetical protein
MTVDQSPEIDPGSATLMITTPPILSSGADLFWSVTYVQPILPHGNPRARDTESVATAPSAEALARCCEAMMTGCCVGHAVAFGAHGVPDTKNHGSVPAGTDTSASLNEARRGGGVALSPSEIVSTNTPKSPVRIAHAL